MFNEVINMQEAHNQKIVSMVKVGGFNYWDWKFPFIHYKEEELLIATEDKIYKEE